MTTADGNDPDPRWMRLTLGMLSPEEEAVLQREDPETYERCRPLDPEVVLANVKASLGEGRSRRAAFPRLARFLARIIGYGRAHHEGASPVKTEERTAILQALRAGPAYGLEVIERVRVATDGKIALGQGNVYPLLRELEAEGFLSSYEGDPLPERGGRPRRYYRLTKAGAAPISAVEAASNPRAGDVWQYPDGDLRVLKCSAPSWGPDAWETAEGKILSLSGLLRVKATLVRRGAEGNAS